MSVWEKYSLDKREKYIKYLQIYGSLSNLFRQKHGDLIPYLDSKYQETLFARVFECENVDIGNTPHDILSVLGNDRIGIGIKTWMGSGPSFQKVMQLKRYKDEFYGCKDDELVHKISSKKNEKMIMDYNRLGLSEDKNIYHYITRDKGRFNIAECAYPLIDLDKITNIDKTNTSISWSDGNKEYRFTFADSQIWQKFDNSRKDTRLLKTFEVEIISDPFDFLFNAYEKLGTTISRGNESDIFEVYLPLYSYRTKEVEEKSGLNAWNSAPKNKGSNRPRPLNEVYIPIPKEFHDKYPDFFIKNIFEYERKRRSCNSRKDKPELRFYLILPNGKKIPSLVTQDNMKGLQSGSRTELDEKGKPIGQAALGQWLLVDVLGLKERTLVTREWLEKKGTDSVRIWRKKDDYENFYIDFAEYGSFEKFMNDKEVSNNDN